MWHLADARRLDNSMTISMAVDIGGIQMKNPVMVASGTFGYGPEYAELVDLNQLGAIVVKGISLKETLGNSIPRMTEVPGGLINAIGLQNPGFDGFVEKYMPFLRQYDVPVMVNIWGKSLEEYVGIAERFDDVEGIAGLELNVSCPNIKEGGIAFGTNIDSLKKVVTAVRNATRLPLITKLSPNVSDIRIFARVAEECGSDALSLINSLPALAIDVETRQPRIANIIGGLTGPAIHHVGVKLVWDAAQAVRIPIIGMGGIMDADDALEFIIAGARSVAVGTANFTDPSTSLRVVAGIQAYLERHQMADISTLSGSFKVRS